MHLFGHKPRLVHQPLVMIPEPTKRWSLQEGIDTVNMIELEMLSIGFATALRGEVLTTGRGREMNLVLIPLTALLPNERVAGERVAAKVLSALLQSTNFAEMDHLRHWMFYSQGKQIDVVFTGVMP